MDPEVRKELAEGLHRASELLGDGPFDSTKRREILRACEAVRAALLGMGFDEGASRKRVVSFLRSVALANGVIGKRTSGRLSHRTFEEDADAALKWLLEKSYLEDGGSEGFMLTDEGYGYLDQHKSELVTAAPERKGGRGRGGASQRSAKPEPKAEAKAEPKTGKAEAKAETEAKAEPELSAEPNLVMLPPAGEPEVSAT